MKKNNFKRGVVIAVCCCAMLNMGCQSPKGNGVYKANDNNPLSSIGGSSIAPAATQAPNDFQGDAAPSVVASATPNMKETEMKGNIGTFIGEEKAKEIALNHAGVAAADTAYIKVDTDWEKTYTKYEVEFYVPATKTEYEYDINATDGSIYKSEQEFKGKG